jgi:two-component system, NarL family, response regulator DesR
LESTGVTKLVVVEDTEIVASGIRATLEQDPDNEIVAVVPSVAMAEGILRSRPIDVVIVDVRLRDGTAFDLIRRMSDSDPVPAYLIVSSFDLAQYVDAALRLGASGYILKIVPAAELLAAVSTVAAGGWAFDPDLVRKTTAAKQLTLSDREREVISRLVAGRSNDEIGVDLKISRKTVEAHLSKLYVKFDVATRVDLVRRAEVEQWLERPISNGRDGTPEGRPEPA